MPIPDKIHELYELMAAPAKRVLKNIDAQRREPAGRASLIDLFEAQKCATPDAVALRTQARCWSYQQLRGEAVSLSVRLRQAGVTQGARVGLFAPRGPQRLRGMLAVLYCGAAYVPLESVASEERLRAVLKDAGIRVVFTQVGRPGFEGLRQLPLEVDSAAIPVEIPRVAPEATACVVYGARATARPEGRVFSHGDIVRLVRAADGAPLAQQLRALWTGSPAFHASTLESWGPLLRGGEVQLAEHASARAAPRMRGGFALVGAGTLPRSRLKAAT